MNESMKVEGAVEFEVNSLYEALLRVHEKRKARGKRYGLAHVLTLSVLAKLGEKTSQKVWRNGSTTASRKCGKV